MNRAILLLAASVVGLLPHTAVYAQCASGGTEADAAEDAADAAARSEAALGALVTRAIGTLSSLSAVVTVSAPDTPEAQRAVDAVQGVLAEIDIGFRRIGLSWPRVSSVSVQFSDTPGPMWPDGSFTPAWTSCGSRDCDILVFREGWDDLPSLRYIMAHEFAHVAQSWVYDRVRDDATGWWYEGTAEWFANVAIPGQNYAAGLIRDFDARSQTTSLTGMCYETVAFFMWAGAEYGLEFPFSLGEFTDEGLKSAEEVAGTLPPEAWHDFIETFLGGGLRYPDGRPAWPNPSLGPTEQAGAGVEVRVEGPILSIPRVTMAFEPGEWEIETSGTTAFTSFSDDGAASWFRMRNGTGSARGFTHTAECNEDSLLVMTSIGLEAATFHVAATPEGEETTCLEACDRPIPVDHCMVGAWSALSTDLPDTYNDIAAGLGGRHDWVYQDMGDNYVVLRPDGTYVQAIVNAESGFEHEIDGEVMRQLVLIVIDARGRWSVQDDRTMVMCTDEFDGQMYNRMSVGGVTETSGPHPIPYDPVFLSGGGSRFQYECAGDSADIRLVQFAFPQVGWQVRRVPMPAPPDEPF